MIDELKTVNSTDLVKMGALLEQADPEGKLQPILMKKIVIEQDALARLNESIRELTDGKNVLLVTDSTHYSVNDGSVKEKIYFTLSKDFDVEWLVLHNDDKDLHADDTNSDRIKASLEGKDAIVGVGGGTICDLCKNATYEYDESLPLIIVQTALSVNAFSDGVAVMLINGVKSTIHSKYPDHLLIDLDVVREAPIDRNLGGYGDLMATWTAPADWYMANRFGMNPNYHSAPGEILFTQCRELLDNSKAMRTMEIPVLEKLANVLTLSGLAMGIAGESSPASGAEHIFGHLIDMSADTRGQNVAYHGAQVAIGSILASIGWKFLFEEFDPTKINVDDCYPEFDEVEKQVHQAFDWIDVKVADECWKGAKKKLELWYANRPNFEEILKNWDDFKDTVSTNFILPPEYLTQCMHEAGAPTRYSQLTPPVDEKTVRWALENCILYRNRFTLPDLLYYLGWWNESFVDRILDYANNLDAGL